MPKRQVETFVLSVGGSLIVTPEGVDVDFLAEFKAFIARQARKGRHFYLVVGGGATARTYMRAAQAVRSVPASERDWIGIRATRLNAQLLKAVLGRQAYPEILTNPETKIKSQHPFVVASGYKPGHSTDHDSVLLAKANGIRTVINLSNIDYAYDKDPRHFPGAKRLEAVGWKEFRKIVGNRWQPGLNVPFDPVASREAAEFGLRVAIMNGRNLPNLEAFLDGKKAKATVIS